MPSKYLNPHRAGEWRRVLVELADDLRVVAEDDDTPEDVRASLQPILCDLLVLTQAHKSHVVTSK